MQQGESGKHSHGGINHTSLHSESAQQWLCHRVPCVPMGLIDKLQLEAGLKAPWELRHEGQFVLTLPEGCT